MIAEDQTEQRCLSRSVGAQERPVFSPAHRPVDVSQDLHVIVRDVDLGHLDQDRRAWLFVPRAVCGQAQGRLWGHSQLGVQVHPFAEHVFARALSDDPALLEPQHVCHTGRDLVLPGRDHDHSWR